MEINQEDKKKEEISQEKDKSKEIPHEKEKEKEKSIISEQENPTKFESKEDSSERSGSIRESGDSLNFNNRSGSFPKKITDRNSETDLDKIIEGKIEGRLNSVSIDTSEFDKNFRKSVNVSYINNLYKGTGTCKSSSRLRRKSILKNIIDCDNIKTIYINVLSNINEIINEIDDFNQISNIFIKNKVYFDEEIDFNQEFSKLSDINMENLEDLSSLFSEELEDMLENLDLEDFLDSVSSVDINMSKDDLKMLKIKHRFKELKEIAQADKQYLKEMIKYEEKKSGGICFSGSSAPSFGGFEQASVNVTIPETGISFDVCI